MQVVQPIRDIKKLHQMESMLKESNQRDYILFRLGVNSGLRISDILKLKVKDLRNQTHFILREQKTGKAQKLKIQPELKKELDQYLKDMNDDDFVIGSQKYTDKLTISTKVKDENGKSKRVVQQIENTSSNSPLQRMQAWRIINKAANEVGIYGEIGCHTLRKTFGYHFYQQYNDNNNRALALLQQIFNHSSSYITLRYIGIVQDEIDDLIDGFDFNYKKTKKKIG